MNTSRNRYHTSIKIACKLNILNNDLLKLIPRSTLHRFKISDFSNIFGLEFTESLERNEFLIKELLQCKSALLVFKGIIKIKNSIIRIKEFSLSSFRK